MVGGASPQAEELLFEPCKEIANNYVLTLNELTRLRFELATARDTARREALEEAAKICESIDRAITDEERASLTFATDRDIIAYQSAAVVLARRIRSLLPSTNEVKGSEDGDV